MRKRNRLDIHAHERHTEALSFCNKITIRRELNHIKHLPNLKN